MEEFLKIVCPSASELLDKNSELKMKEGAGEGVVQRLREDWGGISAVLGTFLSLLR